MEKIFSYISKDYQLPVQELSLSEKREVENRLQDQFFSSSMIFPLYLHKTSGQGILRLDGLDAWNKALEYLQQRETLIFFDRTDEQQALSLFAILPDSRLSQVLEEIPLTNLYFTDRDTSFFLCWSDMEQLYLWGGARDWFLEHMEYLKK
ncbi:hypothetical protein [Risungbinella massiliensis]|uniref:hypothetical protein n=1 Tax=Risungbinella massiliensis TaxID=1329796 RepID=UPI0005CBEA50|nr:hypothetical protein [Risungbinella massiliensis]